MTLPSFADFQQQQLAAGFDEVLERQWAPDTVLPSHTHPFGVQAVLVQGEMWLSTASGEQHLTPGSQFALQRDEPHAERYGPQGATYWVARKNS